MEQPTNSPEKRSRKRAPRKTGRMGEAEKRAAIYLAMAQPDMTDLQIAKTLNRSRAAITNLLDQARATLAENAGYYVKAHLHATAIAAANGNAGPAQWALEHIMEMDDEGKEHRLVEQPAQRYDTGRNHGDGGLTVNVGLVVSQVAPTAPQLPSRPIITLPSLPIERTDNGVSLLDSIG